MKTHGIDIGDVGDPSTIVDVDHQGPRFIITRAEILPLQMGYKAQGSYISSRIVGSHLALVDATGVGAAVAQLTLIHNPIVWQIVTTAGAGARKTPGQQRITLGKDRMIARMVNGMEKGNVVLDCPLEEREPFLDQLRAYHAAATKTGRVRMGAKHGSHDDLITGAALAIWAPEVLKLTDDARS